MERSARLACRVSEEIIRVESVVAQELEQHAVEIVGAGFDGCVDHRSRGMSELGGEGARLHLELLHRIHGRDEGDPIPANCARVRNGVIVHAVKRYFIR